MNDTDRLNWLVRSGATVAYSTDGEACWLHWPYEDEEGFVRNQEGAFVSAREAIDAEMLAEVTPPKRGA